LKNKTNIIGRDERFCIRYTKKFKTIWKCCTINIGY
jgi:hypothetical protein